ncbi:MAG TPA: TetR family transcriptional regulator C-terminal domain-containing protein, partial [Stellaceae bacterium]|nr:TetR family transcriptional regulator C-terminal domain-containing protein [Stellaceae bacterium]
SHYFGSKKELLLFTLRECAARQVARLKSAMKNGAEIADCLGTLLPLDEERLVDSKVWLVFFGAALQDPEIAEVQAQFGARWRHLIAGLLKIRGWFTADTPHRLRDFVAQRLQSAVAGIATHGALGLWPPELQRELMRVEVEAALAILPAASARTVREPAPTPATEAAAENARLRSLLIESLLEVEALRDQRSPPVVPPDRSEAGPWRKAGVA